FVRRTAVLLPALLGALAAVSCSRPGYVLGFAGDLSGVAADLSVAARNGVTLSLEDVNRSGGVGGQKLRLLSLDDHGDPSLAIDADRSLLDQGAVAIIGHFTSAVSLLALPAVEFRQRVMISPFASSPLLADRPARLFFMLQSDAGTEASALASVALEQRVNAVTLIIDEGNRPYTEQFASGFEARFVPGGGRIERSIRILGGESGDREAADSCIRLKPGALLFCLDAEDTAFLCQRIRLAGLHPRLFSSNWVMTADLPRYGGAAVEGLVSMGDLDQGATNPRSLAFRMAYRRRFGMDPPLVAYFGYETVTALARALGRARGAGDLAAALRACGPYPGIQGDFFFDEQGRARRSLKSFVVYHGRFVQADSLLYAGRDAGSAEPRP
ncbi:MAG TPA: ABC transporter substrate-binding protein, partial [Rectinemataceae bacterium]|nr:ABC transporter substrate-binding protein [Rectinemataceae bacterium]